MTSFLPATFGRARSVLFGAALTLSALGCGSDAATPSEENEDGAKADEDEDDSKDTKPTTTKKDAGKPTSSTGGGKVDAGAPKSSETDEAPVASGKDAGVKTSTPAEGKSLWCDALKVFEDKCQSCHGTKTAAGAPMSLVTIADTNAAAPLTKGKKVYEVVGTRVHDTKNPMPPGKPLSAAELAPIDAWIAAGAKDEGVTCAEKAVPQKPEQEWPPAGCDATYKILAGGGKPVMVGAGAETHPQFVIDAPWGNESVQAIAYRPITDNATVLHHWILYDNNSGGTFLNGWAPGQDEAERKPLPEDVGFFLPKGPRSLRLDMHYNNLGGKQSEADQSGMEVCVTKTPRKNVATTFMGFAGIPFVAPGATADITGTCNVSVTKPVFLMSESPHAHKLATHMKFTVKKAGGQSIVMRDAPFAFDAQVSTPLPQLIELKTGDQVITTCTFKNDTNALVTFGENTGNEMCFNFATYYPMGALSCSGGGGLLGGGSNPFGGNLFGGQ